MLTILIAEDDPAMRGFLTTALTRAGYMVHACADGRAAYDVLVAGGVQVDLLLTDIVMPGMDGIELATRAGALNPSLKIMYITGFGTVNADVGGAQVLAKPIHLSSLIDEVKRQLGAG